MRDLREKVVEAIMPELGKQEMVLTDPVSLQRMMAKRCADAAIAAVLDALKEPTPLMISAAVEAGGRSGYTDIVAVHQAMITAFKRDHYLSAMAEEDGKEL